MIKLVGFLIYLGSLLLRWIYGLAAADTLAGIAATGAIFGAGAGLAF